MPSEASILHADADAFFAAVEQRDDPELRGKPVIVGGGVVMAASYEARAHGVRGAMGGAQARRLCPNAIVVPPRFSAYIEASRQLFAVFEQMAPAVEGLSLEEAFLDVSGLERISGTPREIAERLRRRVREEVGLAVTVGVARTKVVAKMASAHAKPDGLLVIEPSREREFLDPLPVERLWGVGEKTAAKLHREGIRLIRELAALEREQLIAIVGGASGRHLHAIARGRDRRRVRSGRRRRSIGSQCALGRRTRTPQELETILSGLVDRVGRRMRAGGRAGRTVCLRLRFGDYSRATRSHTLPQPTTDNQTLLAVARALLTAAMPTISRRGCTLVGLAVQNLTSAGAGVQLALPLDRRSGPQLDAATDEIRARFGSKALRRAALTHERETLATSLLPGDSG